MEKEDLLFLKRLKELANRSYEKSIFTFTNFLALPEQNLYYSIEKELAFVGVTLFGGNAGCDRRMIRFGSPDNLGYEEEFPISCLCIEPISEKFGELLNHRDYLGALMNLGIERESLGDIFIEGKTAYLYCVKRIQEYICENLTKIKHTNVKIYPACMDEQLFVNRFLEETVLASSERIDAVIAGVYHLSRSQSIDLFRGKKVYLNSRLCENNSYTLKTGDILSVRGFGKMEYKGISYTTKKGRLSLKVCIYK